MLHQLGAVPVLAHVAHYPGLQLSHLALLREFGVEGLEIFRTASERSGIANNPASWEEIAAKLGFFPTFGSDYHGPHRPSRLGQFRI